MSLIRALMKKKFKNNQTTHPTIKFLKIAKLLWSLRNIGLMIRIELMVQPFRRLLSQIQKLESIKKLYSPMTQSKKYSKLQ